MSSSIILCPGNIIKFDIFKQEDDQSKKMLKYVGIHSAEYDGEKDMQASSIILLTDLILKFSSYHYHLS
jgi:hypothetical protein